jgi:DNA-binding CsgD family transcriptional regulator
MDEADHWKPGPCCCQAEHLTDREIDVLCELAVGSTNDQAASAMCISEHTIAGHLRSMLARASARNRVELIARAYAAGVLTAHSWPPRWSGRRCLTMPAVRSSSDSLGSGTLLRADPPRFT